MLKKIISVLFVTVLLAGLTNCTSGNQDPESKKSKEEVSEEPLVDMKAKLSKYITVTLNADISGLSDNQKKMLVHLFNAAQIMDDIYWKQSFGDKAALLSKIDDTETTEFVKINYGPWDRLDGNNPFISSYGEKPKGANFYPKDMTVKEFEQFDDPDKNSLYTLIRRNEDGSLKTIWYHEAYAEETEHAVEHLRQAAGLADDPGFQKYLELRADALLNDDYRASDFAWLDMTNNDIDFVVGPIENYEDALFNLKAAHESFILLKDKEWSKKLKKYTKLLPDLQKALPVVEKYKNETPGSEGNQLNAYEVIYYAGDCNAGSKTIAINLPNDELVREKKGSRKLQLKNSMKAKFDMILVPIADVLINEEQRKNISFDAFFTNTMFHEVAHGLGLSYLADNNTVTVRSALQNYYTSIEEGKADILGLFAVTELHKKGEFGDADLMDNYVTFMASIFR
ncbi:MAG: Zn-dependent hydrolase [Bacteroidales bacterium]|nr:Zn-dependent hydrolase [Bacteroidales bacterium]